MLRAMADLAGAEQAALRLPDGARQILHLAAVAGKADWERPRTVDARNTISGVALTTGEPVVVNNYQEHLLAEAAALSQGVNSLLVLPIKSNGRTMAVVNVFSS